MSETNCGLPNVDIFDPVQCSKRWSQCATQQQINVYLNGEIVRTQECLQLFKQAQAGVNEILDNKLKGHDTRIANAESTIALLKASEDALKANMAQLQESNSSFQIGVDGNLKLYQQSINALTTATNNLTTDGQKMWAEINALKGSIDTAKIDEALAGYSAIMEQTKALIQQNNDEVGIQLKGLETKFNTFQANVSNEVAQGEADNAKVIKDFKNSVSDSIDSQNARINQYFTTSDQNIAQFKAEVNGRLSTLDAEVAEFDAKLGKHVVEVDAALNKAAGETDAKLQAISASVEVEAQARKDGDSRLEGMLNATDRAFEKLATDTDNKLLTQYKDAVEREDKIAQYLGEKIDSEIKNVTLQEASDVRDIYARIQSEAEKAEEHTDSSVDALQTALSTRITGLESDLRSAISAGDSANADAISALDAKTDTAVNRIDSTIESLQSDVDSKDKAQTLALQDETEARIQGDADNKAYAEDALNKAVEELDAADALLDHRIDGLYTSSQQEWGELKDSIEKLNDSDAKQWTTINNTVESDNLTRQRVDGLDKRVQELEANSGGDGGSGEGGGGTGGGAEQTLVTSIAPATYPSEVNAILFKQEWVDPNNSPKIGGVTFAYNASTKTIDCTPDEDVLFIEERSGVEWAGTLGIKTSVKLTKLWVSYEVDEPSIEINIRMTSDSRARVSAIIPAHQSVELIKKYEPEPEE